MSGRWKGAVTFACVVLLMVVSSALTSAQTFDVFLPALPGAGQAGLPAVQVASLSPMETVGKSIFFDESLSYNGNQSCASCHEPEAGWTGPISNINDHGAVYEGSIEGRFGNRKPPSAAYATLSPVLYVDKKGTWAGGNFWDGRATGEKLGNPAADQALGPFLNPDEQALPDSACVVYRVCNPGKLDDYPVAFTAVWGEEACDIDWPDDVDETCTTKDATVALDQGDRVKSDQAYDYIGLSIAAYEASPEVNAFSSRFDEPGRANLTKEERRGLALFNGKGKCSNCHPSNGKEPLFTDFTYDNLGVPKNPENPVYVYEPAFADTGLGGFLASLGYDEDVYEDESGKVKVPTLRNVDLRPDNVPDLVKAYTHNGYFKTLEGLVHFYNTRDVLPVCPGEYSEADALKHNCWPEPEVEENVNADELGDLGLTPEEEAAIVAFLKTLSDVQE